MTSIPFAPSSPASVVKAARGELDELNEVLWAAKHPRALLDTVAEIERLESQLAATKARVIVEVDETRAAASEQWGSTADYLTAIGAGRQNHGSRSLRLARALTESYPATLTALHNADISQAQAQVIVTVLDRLPVSGNLRRLGETQLLRDAETLNATELAEAAKLLVELLDPEGDDRRAERQLRRDERAAHLQRFLSVANDGAGGVWIKGRTSVEDAAVIKAALTPLAAPEPAAPGSCGGPKGCPLEDCAHNGRDPRDHGARLLDALVEACHRLLGTETLPTDHGATPRINVTINYADLLDKVGTGLLATGDTISASAVRRMACDASIIPMVLGTQSEVLDVGRSRRLVTPAIWKALVVRDKHCAFPGCRRAPIACDAHHIVSWLDRGGTGIDNLALLCRTHHTMIHETPWQIRLNREDHHPEFIPPVRLDPEQKPVRQRRPRS